MDEEKTQDLNRDELINKAVQFLIHPKLSNSSLSEKKEFLVKKGLTDHEIEKAIQTSGIDRTENAVQPLNAVNQEKVVVRSTGTKVREWALFSVIFGGISYGIYLLAMKLIPVFLIDKDKKIQEIAQNVDNLKETVHLILKNQAHLQETVVSNGEKMKNSSKPTNYDFDSMNTSANSLSIRELKNEIISLKGLLLNKDQFPRAPVNQPIIPAWQLSHKIEEDSIKVDESAKKVEVEEASNKDDSTENKEFTLENTKDEDSYKTLTEHLSVEIEESAITVEETSKTEFSTEKKECALENSNGEDLDSYENVNEQLSVKDEHYSELTPQQSPQLSDVSSEDMDASMLIVQKKDVLPNNLEVTQFENDASAYENTQSTEVLNSDISNMARSNKVSENTSSGSTDNGSYEQLTSTCDTSFEDLNSSIMGLQNNDSNS